MKRIETIINPFKLDAVKEAIERVGIEGLTVSKVNGVGQQETSTASYRGSILVVKYLPKLKIETLVNDYKVVQVVEAIRKAARTGQVGDGKVVVMLVDEVVRIRTGERDSDAI